MAYLCVDKNGYEYMSEGKPRRGEYGWSEDNDLMMAMPKGSIERLLGRAMSWKDEPVNLYFKTKNEGVEIMMRENREFFREIFRMIVDKIEERGV